VVVVNRTVLVPEYEELVDEDRGGVDTQPETPHVATLNLALAGVFRATMAPKIASDRTNVSANSRSFNFKRITSSTALVLSTATPPTSQHYQRRAPEVCSDLYPETLLRIRMAVDRMKLS